MTTRNFESGYNPFDRDAEKITAKLDKIRTPYIWANPRKCKACWKCVDSCAKQVIGKVGFLWHKHIIIENPENCTGCKNCIKVCPYGVFSKEMPDILDDILRMNK